MNDHRDAWEDHELDGEQLDLFAPEPPEPAPPRGAYDEPGERERVYQLTELPGETFEDIFRSAA